MLFVGNLTGKLHNNMKREVVAVRIHKHMHRYKAWKAQKHMQCGYRSTCVDLKLKKLRSMCSADTKARAQIES